MPGSCAKRRVRACTHAISREKTTWVQAPTLQLINNGMKPEKRIKLWVLSEPAVYCEPHSSSICLALLLKVQ
jgi:hypothetical protein